MNNFKFYISNSNYLYLLDLNNQSMYPIYILKPVNESYGYYGTLYRGFLKQQSIYTITEFLGCISSGSFTEISEEEFNKHLMLKELII